MGLVARRAFLPLVAVLLLAPGAAAWHWDDEVDLEKHGARAGDARVVEDAGECIDAIAGTGTNCMVLYAHVLNLLGAAPLNTQRPADCAPDLAQGFTGAPGVEPYWEFNQILFRSVTQFVPYPPGCEQDVARDAPAQGIAADIEIAPTIPITGHLYLSADSTEFSPLGIGTGADSTGLGAIPCLTVRMTLEIGRHPGVGVVVAMGETTKTIVTLPVDDAPLVLPEPCPGAQGLVFPEQVTEFVVELHGAEARLLEGEEFVVHAHWFQWEAPPLDENRTRVVQHQWNMHTGPEHANRIVLPVRPSLVIERLNMREADGILYIAADVQNPLGAYDLDTANIRLTVIGPDGTETRIDAPEHHRYDFSTHTAPGALRIIHGWEYTAAPPEPGMYTLEYAIANWQHTEVARHATELWVARDGSWSTEPARDAPPEDLQWSRDEFTLLLGLAVLATGLVYLSAAAGRFRPRP